MKKLIAILLSLATPSWSAVAFVKCVNEYASDGSLTITGTTAGNTLIVGSSGSSATTTWTPSDGHNTYTNLTYFQTANGVPMSISLAYAVNIAGGNETVATTNGGSEDQGMTICEFSGVATASTLDNSTGTVSGAVASATPTSNAFTTTVTDLIIAYYANEASGSDPTAGAGYTIDANHNTSHFDGMEYSLNVSAGSQTPSFSVSSNNNWIMFAIALKAAAAAGATVPPQSSVIVTDDED